MKIVVVFTMFCIIDIIIFIWIIFTLIWIIFGIKKTREKMSISENNRDNMRYCEIIIDNERYIVFDYKKIFSQNNRTISRLDISQYDII